MRLYNQTNSKLSWQFGSRHFSAEPFGPVEIPEQFVAFCRRRRLPLDVSPIAPEVKAKALVEEEKTAERNDEIRRLKDSLEIAVATERSAKAEAMAEKQELAAAREKIGQLEKALTKAADQLRATEADKAALSAELSDLARKLASVEDKARKAGARETSGARQLQPAG